ncbi:hypothetical protein [Pseudomonas paeninsulae]|uniref:hypothetical protein n=1 Tax=Pseudomonas paeninsulae TaxID=3110772 RepID=UPI002D7A0BF8|nr:hypothetical protein [Pseudomonas sp. IT1137]
MSKATKITWLISAGNGKLLPAVWAEPNFNNRRPNHLANLLEMMVLLQIAFRRLPFYKQAPYETFAPYIIFFQPNRHAVIWHAVTVMNSVLATIH